jgi:hypothetical protein
MDRQLEAKRAIVGDGSRDVGLPGARGAIHY